ncbi:MAG: BlaI/MecI/CopY family transcriptional regulator [Propionibacteriaceae bacterium]|jgi:predicted transcriptional regulator|nr:BlaI/MecI/CopY family transcriptional regulator [Propionibacteriaceae bacterium]
MALLGDLETSVMEVLWGSDRPLSVHEVHSALRKERDLAYTTIMTVLCRLTKKGIASRQLEGRAWLYKPVATRVDMVMGEIQDLLSGLPATEQSAALERIAEKVAS